MLLPVAAGALDAGVAQARVPGHLVISLAIPYLVGRALPEVHVVHILLGLLAVPTIAAAFDPGDLGWPYLVVAVIGAALTALIVSFGQRHGGRDWPPDTGQLRRFHILIGLAGVAVAATFLVSFVWGGRADHDAAVAARKLRAAMEAVEVPDPGPGSYFADVERASGLRVVSGHLTGDVLVVRVEVRSGLVERCVRGTRRPGTAPVVEVLPRSCG